MLTLFFGQHHVEVECSNAQLDRSAGPIELFGLIDVVVQVLELGVRSRGFHEVHTVLLVDPESTALRLGLRCSPRAEVAIHFRQAIQLKLTLLVNEASSLFVRHLPNEIARPDRRHLVQLATVVIVNVVDKAVRIL